MEVEKANKKKRHVFDVFPEEIWELLLEQVKAPKDKLTILHSNRKLDAVFRKNKAKWLFHEILPFILDVTGNDPSMRSTLLTCRRISKLCCEVVDKYIDSQIENYLMPPKFAEPDPSFFMSVATINRFLQQAQTHPLERSPIIGQFLQVYCANNGPEDFPTAQDVIPLLERVGAQMKILTMFSLIRHQEDAIDFVHQTLSLTQNIKTLAVGMPYFTPDDYEEDSVGLPDLPQLEYLILVGSAGGYLDIFTFRQYFHQLKYLSMDFSLWKRSYNQKGVFPNLTTLYFRDVAILAENEENFCEILLWLDAPNLRRLHFGLRSCSAHVKLAKENVSLLTKDGLFYLNKKYKDTLWAVVTGEWKEGERRGVEDEEDDDDEWNDYLLPPQLQEEHRQMRDNNHPVLLRSYLQFTAVDPSKLTLYKLFRAFIAEERSRTSDDNDGSSETESSMDLVATVPQSSSDNASSVKTNEEDKLGSDESDGPLVDDSGPQSAAVQELNNAGVTNENCVSSLEPATDSKDINEPTQFVPPNSHEVNVIIANGNQGSSPQVANSADVTDDASRPAALASAKRNGVIYKVIFPDEKCSNRTVSSAETDFSMKIAVAQSVPAPTSTSPSSSVYSGRHRDNHERLCFRNKMKEKKKKSVLRRVGDAVLSGILSWF